MAAMEERSNALRDMTSRAASRIPSRRESPGKKGRLGPEGPGGRVETDMSVWPALLPCYVVPPSRGLFRRRLADASPSSLEGDHGGSPASRWRQAWQSGDGDRKRPDRQGGPSRDMGRLASSCPESVTWDGTPYRFSGRSGVPPRQSAGVRRCGHTAAPSRITRVSASPRGWDGGSSPHQRSVAPSSDATCS